MGQVQLGDPINTKTKSMGLHKVGEHLHTYLTCKLKPLLAKPDLPLALPLLPVGTWPALPRAVGP